MEQTDPTDRRLSFREMATDAIRYWEPRRLIFNGALALIVIVYFLLGWPTSLRTFTIDGILFLFLLAVASNILYCAAYVVDVFAQFSGFRDVWVRFRWILLTVGIVFAGIITRFFALGFFGGYG
jgi:hypothetical protein